MTRALDARGIPNGRGQRKSKARNWIPAYAGMTSEKQELDPFAGMTSKEQELDFRLRGDDERAEKNEMTSPATIEAPLMQK